MASLKTPVSLILGSYNQVKTLQWLFISLSRQTHPLFEVVVADDGSTDGTSELCAQAAYSFSIHFLTQKKQGFRKAQILNRAIEKAQGEYLIFVDADTFVGPHFVEDHLSLAEDNAFVCGRRVDLGEAYSQRLTEAQIRSNFVHPFQWAFLWDCLVGDTQGWKRSVRVQARFLRACLGYNREIDLLGSNMSLWKKDLLEVNGFNEDFQTYWGEDGDLYIRLRNRGKKAINGKGLCIQYHVFHPRREAPLENVMLHQSLLKNNTYCWAERGLIQKKNELGLF